MQDRRGRKNQEEDDDQRIKEDQERDNSKRKEESGKMSTWRSRGRDENKTIIAQEKEIEKKRGKRKLEDKEKN